VEHAGSSFDVTETELAEEDKPSTRAGHSLGNNQPCQKSCAAAKKK